MNGVKLNRLQWYRITSTYLVTNYIGVNNNKKGGEQIENPKAGLGPYLPSQFCEPSIAGQLRYPHDSRTPWAQRCANDHDLYTHH